MTDEQIVKALECCERKSCHECPYRMEKVCHQRNPMIGDILDLINRQRAEIERLKNYNEDLLKSNTILSNYVDKCDMGSLVKDFIKSHI